MKTRLYAAPAVKGLTHPVIVIWHIEGGRKQDVGTMPQHGRCPKIEPTSCDMLYSTVWFADNRLIE